MKQILIEDDLRWPSVMHPAHAAALDSARNLAARLEQENSELLRRCTDLIHLWTTTGSMAHAAQLAEALDLGADRDAEALDVDGTGCLSPLSAERASTVSGKEPSATVRIASPAQPLARLPVVTARMLAANEPNALDVAIGPRPWSEHLPIVTSEDLK